MNKFALPHLATINHVPLFWLVVLLGTAAFVGLMILLHQAPPRVKKAVVVGLTFLAGLIIVVEYLLPTHATKAGPSNQLTDFVKQYSDYMLNITIWMFGLGIISLLIVHGRRIFGVKPGWHNSMAFFLAFLAMAVFGIMTNGGNDGPATALKTYDVLFSAVLINLDSTMFALLAFYIASAAYRAFRVRTVEASLLMFSALLVMLGMVSFGVLLTHWIPVDSIWAGLRVERLSLWLLNWINMPVQRAVTIGVEVGALAMSMRLWLSLERGSFFSQES